MVSGSYTRFVITGDARTGSNMLVQALNVNTAVRCFREIFHNRMPYIDYNIDAYDPNDPTDLGLRETDQVKFLESRIFCAQPSQFRAVGFKYLYGHFWGHDPVTEFLRQDANLRVIHLKRRNMLRLLVSVRLAEATNLWIEDWGAPRKRPLVVRAASAVTHPVRTLQLIFGRIPPPTHAKPTLNMTPEDCSQWFTRTSREIQRTDALFARQARLDVFYEDMVSNRESTFDAVQRFLGVEPAPFETTLRKQNPEPLRELISNYDELRVAFAGSPEEAFFDD